MNTLPKYATEYAIWRQEGDLHCMKITNIMHATLQETHMTLRGPIYNKTKGTAYPMHYGFLTIIETETKFLFSLSLHFNNETKYLEPDIVQTTSLLSMP